MMNQSFVYILTNKFRTTFYIGITSDLAKRMGNIKKELPQNLQRSTMLLIWCTLKFILILIRLLQEKNN
nr:GIY-YIG nuclease family protein [Allomuricauda aequoris]